MKYKSLYYGGTETFLDGYIGHGTSIFDKPSHIIKLATMDSMSVIFYDFDLFEFFVLDSILYHTAIRCKCPVSETVSITGADIKLITKNGEIKHRRMIPFLWGKQSPFHFPYQMLK